MRCSFARSGPCDLGHCLPHQPFAMLLLSAHANCCERFKNVMGAIRISQGAVDGPKGQPAVHVAVEAVEAVTDGERDQLKMYQKISNRLKR